MIRNLLLALLISAPLSWGASLDIRRVDDSRPWGNPEALVVIHSASTSSDFLTNNNTGNGPWYRITDFHLYGDNVAAYCQANQVLAPYCDGRLPWNMRVGCNSSQQASEMFNTLAGTIIHVRTPRPDSLYVWSFYCANGNTTYSVKGTFSLKPTPPSCVASSAHIAMEGLVRQTGISGSADIRLQCTAPADVVLSVANAGHLEMGGELDVRVTLPGGLDNIQISDLLDRSIKVTASVTSPPMVAGTFSGSTVVTISIE